MANDKDNRRVALKSFGMMAVELESPSGEKLQIAKDNTAKLTIAIPASLQSSAPSLSACGTLMSIRDCEKKRELQQNPELLMWEK